MAYTADISRLNPGCFLFLIDQSGSMAQALGGQPGVRKMDSAAETLNRTLDTLCQRCSQGLDLRDYFHVAAFGYRTDLKGSSKVSSLLPDTTTETPFLLISKVVELAQVADRQVKVSDGAGGLVEVTQSVPYWIQPTAEYGTPMCEALDLAAHAADQWISEHPDSYPPIVINISDGMATDGDPEPFAQNLMSMATKDGQLLMFNAHLSETATRPIQFPNDDVPLPDDHSQKLYRMSSVLPEANRALAVTLDLAMPEQARGFVFNANLEALVQFLDIGTRGVASVDLH